MLARVYSAILLGLQSIKVEVEVDSHRGIPGLLIIGLPTKTVAEAKERITASLQHCGVRIKSKRTVVNLAPADVPKRCSHLELAIAIGLLKMYGEIEYKTDDTFFCGELSLNGELKGIRGALPLVLAAKDMGFSKAVIPASNAAEVQLVKGITIYPLHHLSEFLRFVQDGTPLPRLQPVPFTTIPTPVKGLSLDDIQGQALAKRALSIAAAGGHNLLLIGPPGAGKSLLAQALPTLLPPLTETEAIELTNIYSLAGENDSQIVTQRPFRSPHHSISDIALLGGHQLKPGEISLAHRGVLFLDEFPEFNRSAIESLRLPLENHTISLSRAEGHISYPAAFSLIAAANPCRCGFAGSTKKQCRCSARDLELYQRKISGPILDRIDLHVYLAEPEQLVIQAQATTSVGLTNLITQIQTARMHQQQRYQHRFHTNSELPFNAIKTYCSINPNAEQFLQQAADKLHLSPRGFFKVVKVAQTIADLESAPTIDTPHLAEALQYRFEKLDEV